MMIYTNVGYINTDCVERVYTRKSSDGKRETHLLLKGDEVVTTRKDESRVINEFCPVVPANEGFNVALAIRDDSGGEWSAELFPIVAWRIRDGDPETDSPRRAWYRK
jgi:hypothetical protein